jgi:enterobacteria phage integrase
VAAAPPSGLLASTPPVARRCRQPFTRQRLAYALLLYTGQRVGDVAKMNRADISEEMIHVIQEKTGADIWVPIDPNLTAAMKAYPAKGLTLIGDANGRPIKRAALSALMRNAIKEAGLPPRCVSHGLRKAAMRLLAEADATEKQIGAISGHKTLKEIERYTKAADQKKLARAGMDKLRGKKNGP